MWAQSGGQEIDELVTSFTLENKISSLDTKQDYSVCLTSAETTQIEYGKRKQYLTEAKESSKTFKKKIIDAIMSLEREGYVA